MNKNCLTLIILLTLLSACDLVVDVDVPIKEPSITLNSVFFQDSTWKAQLILDRHILDDTDFRTIDDGQVVIFEEGYAIDTLSGQGNGVYVGDSKTLPGRSYEIRVLSPLYGSVSASSYVPFPVEIDNVEIEQPAGTSADGTKISMTFEMTDRPSEDNYYQLVIFSARKYYDHRSGEMRISSFPVPLESKDPIIVNAISRANDGVFFEDDLFEGQSISLKLESPSLMHSADTLKLKFCLRTLSKDYYDYQVTLQLQEQTSDDPFAQPVNVYNNIENGFGIFGGLSQSVYVYSE